MFRKNPFNTFVREAFACHTITAQRWGYVRQDIRRRAIERFDPNFFKENPELKKQFHVGK